MSLTIDPYMVPSITQYIQCARKRQFVSRKQALNAGKKQRQINGAKLKAYECPHCGGWHTCKDRKAMKR